MNRSLRFGEWLCTFALLSLFLLSACATEVPKYQIGMSMDSAKAKMSKPYEVKHAAIATLMEWVNSLPSVEVMKASPGAVSEALEVTVLLLAPFAPHICEELWERMEKISSIYHASWPDYDNRLIADTEYEMVIQVNGRPKARITVAADASEEAIRSSAASSVRSEIQSKTVRRIIVVRGKLVNIVTA
jgi:leucyl-tRNA synthetase